MALDAANPTERVEQLIVLTQRLTRMMSQEAEAFESHRPHDVVAGAEETARLANLYRHESLRIRKDPVLKEMLEGLRATVTEESAPFEPEAGAYGGGHGHHEHGQHLLAPVPLRQKIHRPGDAA